MKWRTTNHGDGVVFVPPFVWHFKPQTSEEPPATCPRSDDVCDFPDCRCPRQATPEETTP